MFANRRVFDEDVVPEHERVVHRQVELERLEQSLRPADDGTVTTDVTYVLGPTGTGKTMSTSLVLQRLLDLDSD